LRNTGPVINTLNPNGDRTPMGTEILVKLMPCLMAYKIHIGVAIRTRVVVGIGTLKGSVIEIPEEIVIGIRVGKGIESGIGMSLEINPGIAKKSRDNDRKRDSRDRVRDGESSSRDSSRDRDSGKDRDSNRGPISDRDGIRLLRDREDKVKMI